jgi:hypothetical protein
VKLIGDYLAGRLRRRAAAAFEHHLSQCPDCEAFLKTYKKTIELTTSFLRTPGFQGLQVHQLP